MQTYKLVALTGVMVLIGAGVMTFGYNSADTVRIVTYSDKMSESKIVSTTGFYTRFGYKKDVPYKREITYQYKGADVTIKIGEADTFTPQYTEKE